MKTLRLLLALGLLALPALTHAGAVIREQGAIYLEDLLVKPVRLATLADTPIYYKIDLARYLGTLKKGQIVEVQAISDAAYRIRGQAQQGQVVGWVDPKYLNPLKKDFLENLKQNSARHDEIAALIAKNEVAINMTPEEVGLSLGRPAKKSARLDAKGREEVWEFVRYERVPQETTGYDRFGNLVQTITYLKVPAGKLSVSFANNLVSAIEQTEGTLERDARVKIVPAPFVVDF